MAARLLCRAESGRLPHRLSAWGLLPTHHSERPRRKVRTQGSTAKPWTGCPELGGCARRGLWAAQGPRGRRALARRLHWVLSHHSGLAQGSLHHGGRPRQPTTGAGRRTRSRESPTALQGRNSSPWPSEALSGPVSVQCSIGGPAAWPPPCCPGKVPGPWAPLCCPGEVPGAWAPPCCPGEVPAAWPPHCCPGKVPGAWPPPCCRGRFLETPPSAPRGTPVVNTEGGAGTLRESGPRGPSAPLPPLPLEGSHNSRGGRQSRAPQSEMWNPLEAGDGGLSGDLVSQSRRLQEPLLAPEEKMGSPAPRETPWWGSAWLVGFTPLCAQSRLTYRGRGAGGPGEPSAVQAASVLTA